MKIKTRLILVLFTLILFGCSKETQMNVETDGISEDTQAILDMLNNKELAFGSEIFKLMGNLNCT